MPAFLPKQDTDVDYNIIKEFPGELQVFIDEVSFETRVHSFF